MVLAASSASARICSTPRRHSSARSSASHGSIVGLPSGKLAVAAPLSATSAHSSAWPGFPVKAEIIAARTATAG